MASSPASERRARLIREMAQELNSTRHSLQSNPDFADFTGSNLSVEEESSQAYQEHSQPLPQLPSDDRKGSRLRSRPSGDFIIDSSAIGRAFPDMTGSDDTIDDGSSISIELGRGLREGARNLSSQDGDSMTAGQSGRYKLDLSKLPSRTTSHNTKPRQSTLREVQNTNDISSQMRSSPPPFKTTADGTSGSSRHSSAEQAQKYTFKPTVEEGSDHTGSSAGGNSTQNITTRSSRFGNGLSKADFAIPKRYTSGRDLLRDVHQNNILANSSHKVAKPTVDNPTVTTTNGGTAQSFALPNMPNMSELVSGIYDDGTPVFSRTTAGRFQQAKSLPDHHAVQSIPVPQDEEAIMLSLRLLQEKVRQLEKSKAEAEISMKELHNRNRALEDEKRELRRSSKRYDSGVGSSGASDAGDEALSNTQRLAMDKHRMQSTVRNLQSELDGANRRAAVAEANAINIASERDSAISQLGVAFVTQEELKVDNENLKEDNRKLKLEVKKYRAAIAQYLQRAESEKTETKSKVMEAESMPQETRSVDCQVIDVDTPRRPETRRETSQASVRRPEDRSTTRRDATRESSYPEPASAIQLPKRRKRRIVVEEYTATSDFQGFDDETLERIREASRNLTQNMTQNLTDNRARSRQTSTVHTRQITRDREVSVHSQPASRVASTVKHATEEIQAPLRDGVGQPRQRSRAPSVRRVKEFQNTRPSMTAVQDTDQDATQASRVSFLEEGDVTMLRKMLEKEHLQKKGRIPMDDVRQPDLEFDQRDITHLTSQTRHLPRRNSTKEATGRQNIRPETTVHTEIEEDEQTNLTKPQDKIHRRRHSEESLFLRRAPSRKRNDAAEDMTSAFILPDITMEVRQRHHSQGAADATNPISVNPEAFPPETPHEAQNCTVCARNVGNCTHEQSYSAEQIKIPDPILASERIADLALDGEDHTRRPSEPPADALARTIKALEDEFAHLGIHLATLQQQYNELDPSLQKRKRKSLGANIDSVRATMDAKGDQVYALYDVLEGQKAGGGVAEMTEQELNDTLSSVLGEEGNLANLGMPSGIMFKRGQKTSSANVTPAKERPQPRRLSTIISEPTGELDGRGDGTQKSAAERAGAGNNSTGNQKVDTPSAVRKFPWDESYDDDDADDISWQGFDDSLDLTRTSHKSNTSSKRKGATATLDL